jgi:hypothetical protein
MSPTAAMLMELGVVVGVWSVESGVSGVVIVAAMVGVEVGSGVAAGAGASSFEQAAIRKRANAASNAWRGLTVRAAACGRGVSLKRTSRSGPR